MPRLHKKRDKAQNNNLIPALIIMGVLCIFGGVFAISYNKTSHSTKLDKNTLCPVNGLASKTIVLIDKTDGLSAVQTEALRRYILAWSKEVQEGGLLRIYEVTENSDLQKPIASLCNPGDGHNASIVDSSPALLRKRYKAAFEGPIEELLASLNGNLSSKYSPIMEAIQAIDIQEFGPDSPDVPKKLIIVSDFIQNSKNFNMLSAVPNSKAFEQTKFAKMSYMDLSDIDIEAYLLFNPSSNIQTDQFGLFWIDWFRNRGTTISLLKIPGGKYVPH